MCLRATWRLFLARPVKPEKLPENASARRAAKVHCQALLVGLLLLPWLIGCTREPPSYRIQSQGFGTMVEISFHRESEARARTLGAQVMAEFNRLHDRYHAWQPSALTELNDHCGRATCVTTALAFPPSIRR